MEHVKTDPFADLSSVVGIGQTEQPKDLKSVLPNWASDGYGIRGPQKPVIRPIDEASWEFEQSVKRSYAESPLGEAQNGACCYGIWPGISCIETTAADCATRESGHYNGNGTTCDDVDCSKGACCTFSGGCFDTFDFLCGDCSPSQSCWMGYGSSCATTPCLGACCCFREDGESTCEGIITYADCLAVCPSPPYSSGWLLNGACADLGCPTPGVQGACCVDEECSVTGPSHCEGTYLGDGTNCDDDPCTPKGACCDGSDCSILSEGDCDGAGGIYYGDESVCSPNPCPPPCPCGGFENPHLPGRKFLTFKAHGIYTISAHTDCRIEEGCPFCAGSCEFANTCTAEEASAQINPETCEFTETVGNWTSTVTSSKICICGGEDPCECEEGEEPTCQQYGELPADVTGTHHVFYPLQACTFDLLALEMDREIVNGDRSATITETLTYTQDGSCGSHEVQTWEATYEYSDECVA